MITHEFAYFIAIVMLIPIEIMLFARKSPLKYNLLIAAFLIYTAMVADVTLFPITYDGVGYDYEYNFIPFSSIIGSLSDINEYSLLSVVGNIIMFMPLGFLLPLLINRTKKRKLYVFLLIFLGSTVLVEFVQFIIGIMVKYKYRCVDIDDIILNFSGAVIGYVIYKITPKKIKALLTE